MTDIGIYGSRKALGALADQLKEALDQPGKNVETTIYAHANSGGSPEVIITFGNDDSEPDDGGYQGDTVNDILVDIELG